MCSNFCSVMSTYYMDIVKILYSVSQKNMCNLGNNSAKC